MIVAKLLKYNVALDVRKLECLNKIASYLNTGLKLNTQYVNLNVTRWWEHVGGNLKCKNELLYWCIKFVKEALATILIKKNYVLEIGK